MTAVYVAAPLNARSNRDLEQPIGASQPPRGLRELSAVMFEFIKGHGKVAGPKVENVVGRRNGCTGRPVPQ
jgi:hypothetical protein